MTFNIAVFASTRGNVFESILEKKLEKNFDIKISFLFSNRENCGAVEIAKKNKIPVYTFKPKKNESREDYDKKILKICEKEKIDLIVLVGYMRLFSPFFVRKFWRKIINVHPSLLPKFPGMDLNVHRAVLDAGEKFSGMSIHFVDEGVDTGEIICQKKLKINKNETPESLKKRVQDLEKKWYPEIIKTFTTGKFL